MKEDRNKNKLKVSAQRRVSRKSAGMKDPVGPFILKHEFEIEKHRVRSVNVTPNDRYLIITNEVNPLIRVVDLGIFEFLPHEYNGHNESVRLTSITPDGKFFYSGSWDATIRKYELSTGKCLETYAVDRLGRIPSVFIDPKLKYLFTASYDVDTDINLGNRGRCWDLSKKKVLNLYPHSDMRTAPESMDIFYDQEHVYTGSDDGSAFRWDLFSEKPVIQYFKGERFGVRKITVSQNYFVCACTDGMVRMYDKWSGKHIKNFIYHSYTQVMDVKISNDESRLVSCTDDGYLRCVDLSSFSVIFQKRVHVDRIWSLCLAFGDKIVITGSDDGSVVFVDDRGKILAQFFNSVEDDFLITCPRDEVFPNGCFYTTNSDLVTVYEDYSKENKRKNLALDDPRRIDYINQLNLKNIIIAKLGTNANYHTLTKDHIKQNEGYDLNRFSGPRLLGA